MSATANFRKQHAEIVEIIQRIELTLDAEKLKVEAGEARKLLITLLGRLAVHLAMEDRALYPRLEKHDDETIRSMAQKFFSEMSGLKPAVDAYSRKWVESEIRANAAAFCAETKALFSLLSDRIRRENTQLYLLVDAAAEA